MSRRNLTLLLVAIAFCLLCSGRGEQDPFARFVVDGYEKIDRYAYTHVPDEELFQGAMQGMVDVLHRRGDGHSQFITPERAKMFREEIDQEIAGIGVRLHLEGDPLTVKVAGPPLPGKPADRAGVRADDTILAIDEFAITEVSPMTFQTDVIGRMRGIPGEPLKLTVLHDGDDQPVTLDMVREIISLDSVRGDRLLSDQSWQFALEEDPRIALVRVSSFGAKTYGELETLLPELMQQGTQAVILDLRGDPGGLLDAAVATCELFLPANKLIVETRNRRGQTKSEWESSTDGPYLDIPLVVLVDRNSASASEIVAACLQDYDRAVVIGERSFGKGTVQETLSMQAGDSTLKLTTASFWRPSGRNIHRHEDDRETALADPDWGVTPNEGLDVDMTEEQLIELAKARAERDATIYDPTKPDEAPLLNDPAVDVAVAYLQQLLDSASGQ
ncbi:S41 family peptidase [Aeoliella sp. ICT_H6.2]|uniref:S41 family peptidase n=1 Tax=Aeoliella straminimaris TaxID=2954799 RepID=A0A9X2FFF2_9BACT|nr:S41 family peptidase [Aeoliella straminimaris]MCO6047198.1 S41 family peptidase [Aeoliella straminimaris]